MAKDAKSSASARHFQRYTDFCKDVCDEEDGVYAPKHVRSDVNPVDFMGKVVTAQKYFISTQYLMNLKAMVPFEDASPEADQELQLDRRTVEGGSRSLIPPDTDER